MDAVAGWALRAPDVSMPIACASGSFWPKRDVFRIVHARGVIPNTLSRNTGFNQSADGSIVLVIAGRFWRQGSPSRRLSLDCNGTTRQRVVLDSSVTAGNKRLLLLRLIKLLSSSSSPPPRYATVSWAYLFRLIKLLPSSFSSIECINAV